MRSSWSSLALLSIVAALACVAPRLAAANVVPTVRMVSPHDCALVESDFNHETTVVAEAEDADGSIVAVRFYSEFDGLCSIDSFPPYTSNCRLLILVANSTPGTEGVLGTPSTQCNCTILSYQPQTHLYAVAVDNQGATATSDTVGVTPWFSWENPAGTPLALPDAGFEATPLADGASVTGPGTIGGWTFAATAGATAGVLNPTAGAYPAAGGNGTPAGADGANLALLSTPAGTADSAHVFRALPDTLRHWSRYWLEVRVGWPLDAPPEAASPFEDAAFDLVAGSTVIARGSCSAVWTPGEFFPLLAVAVTDDLPPALIGQPLSVHVRLDAGPAARTVHIDRVSLRRESYRRPDVGVPGTPGGTGFVARAVPNPASGHASVEFSLESEGTVTLTILDIAGRAVARVTSPVLAVGPQRLALPVDLAPGVYFARVEAGSRSAGTRFVRLGR